MKRMYGCYISQPACKYTDLTSRMECGSMTKMMHMRFRRKPKKLTIRINAEVSKVIDDNIGLGAKSAYIRMLIENDIKRCNLWKNSMEE